MSYSALYSICNYNSCVFPYIHKLYVIKIIVFVGANRFDHKFNSGIEIFMFVCVCVSDLEKELCNWLRAALKIHCSSAMMNNSLYK